jgi:hypothetical protein
VEYQFSRNNNDDRIYSANKENSELSVMRDEKMRLNTKLDEFSNILKTFQDNQNKYLEENQQLRQKI